MNNYIQILNPWETNKIIFTNYFVAVNIVKVFLCKGVKFRGKKLLTQSVWKSDFQTLIHLELFYALTLRAEKYLDTENSTFQHFDK